MNSYITIKKVGRQYIAYFRGTNNQVLNTNREPIIRDTKKEIIDYINANWNELTFYN